MSFSSKALSVALAASLATPPVSAAPGFQRRSLPLRFAAALPATLPGAAGGLPPFSAPRALAGAVSEADSATAPFAPVFRRCEAAELDAPAFAGGRPVLILQDIHLDAAAQGAIGDAIEATATEAARRGRTLWVGMEAADRAEVDYGVYRSYPDLAAMRTAARAMLGAGLLNGVERAAIGWSFPNAGGKFFRVTGVDDWALYRSHVRALIEGRKRSAEVARALAQWDAVFARASASWPAPVRELSEARRAREAGQLSFPDYALFLADRLPRWTGPLAALAAARRLEKAFSFDAARGERASAMDALIASADRSERERLAQAMSRFAASASAVRSSAASELAAAFRAHGLAARFPAWAAYLDYASLAATVRPLDAVNDAAAAEERFVEGAGLSARDRELWRLETRRFLLARLAAHALTRAEWDAMKEDESVFDTGARLAALTGTPVAGPAALWRAQAQFYVWADRRDRAMAARFAARLEETPDALGILVVGGFHADGVARELSRRGFSVESAVPRAFHPSSASSLDYLAAERLPADRLFTGDRLFLNLPALTALPANAGGVGPELAADVALSSADALRSGRGRRGRLRTVFLPIPRRGARGLVMPVTDEQGRDAGVLVADAGSRPARIRRVPVPVWAAAVAVAALIPLLGATGGPAGLWAWASAVGSAAAGSKAVWVVVGTAVLGGLAAAFFQAPWIQDGQVAILERPADWRQAAVVSREDVLDGPPAVHGSLRAFVRLQRGVVQSEMPSTMEYPAPLASDVKSAHAAETAPAVAPTGAVFPERLQRQAERAADPLRFEATGELISEFEEFLRERWRPMGPEAMDGYELEAVHTETAVYERLVAIALLRAESPSFAEKMLQQLRIVATDFTDWPRAGQPARTPEERVRWIADVKKEAALLLEPGYPGPTLIDNALRATASTALSPDFSLLLWTLRNRDTLDGGAVRREIGEKAPGRAAELERALSASRLAFKTGRETVYLSVDDILNLSEANRRIAVGIQSFRDAEPVIEEAAPSIDRVEMARRLGAAMADAVADTPVPPAGAFVVVNRVASVLTAALARSARPDNPFLAEAEALRSTLTRQLAYRRRLEPNSLQWRRVDVAIADTLEAIRVAKFLSLLDGFAPRDRLFEILAKRRSLYRQEVKVTRTAASIEPELRAPYHERRSALLRRIWDLDQELGRYFNGLMSEAVHAPGPRGTLAAWAGRAGASGWGSKRLQAVTAPIGESDFSSTDAMNDGPPSDFYLTGEPGGPAVDSTSETKIFRVTQPDSAAAAARAYAGVAFFGDEATDWAFALIGAALPGGPLSGALLGARAARELAGRLDEIMESEPGGVALTFRWARRTLSKAASGERVARRELAAALGAPLTAVAEAEAAADPVFALFGFHVDAGLSEGVREQAERAAVALGLSNADVRVRVFDDDRGSPAQTAFVQKSSSDGRDVYTIRLTAGVLRAFRRDARQMVRDYAAWGVPVRWSEEEAFQVSVRALIAHELGQAGRGLSDATLAGAGLAPWTTVRAAWSQLPAEERRRRALDLLDPDSAARRLVSPMENGGAADGLLALRGMADRIAPAADTWSDRLPVRRWLDRFAPHVVHLNHTGAALDVLSSGVLMGEGLNDVGGETADYLQTMARAASEAKGTPRAVAGFLSGGVGRERTLVVFDQRRSLLDFVDAALGHLAGNDRTPLCILETRGALAARLERYIAYLDDTGAERDLVRARAVRAALKTGALSLISADGWRQPVRGADGRWLVNDALLDHYDRAFTAATGSSPGRIVLLSDWRALTVSAAERARWGDAIIWALNVQLLRDAATGVRSASALLLARQA